MENVRYGIIGMGNQGSYYLDLFSDKKLVPCGEITAICDINPSKLESAKEKQGFGGATFTDYKDLITSGLVDAIIIETPHYIHPEIAIYGLTHGVHVLCDKPEGVYTKQVKELNDVAKNSDKLFGLIYNQRTNCLYRKMREIIVDGEIGEVRRINWIITNWFRAQSYYDSSSWRATWKGEGGGVLMNQCPHQLDLLQWVVGMMPKRIKSFCSFGKWHDIEVEDDVTAYLEYENGATGVFVTTTGEGCGSNRFEVIGDKGKLVVENDKLIFTKLEVSTKEFCANSPAPFAKPPQTVFEVETDGENEQHVGIFKNFTNAILGKEELFVSGDEGIKCVELINAMLLSTFLDKTVELPINDELYFEELNKRIAAGKDKQVEEKLLDTTGSFGSTKG